MSYFKNLFVLLLVLIIPTGFAFGNSSESVIRFSEKDGGIVATKTVTTQTDSSIRLDLPSGFPNNCLIGSSRTLYRVGDSIDCPARTQTVHRFDLENMKATVIKRADTQYSVSRTEYGVTAKVSPEKTWVSDLDSKATTWVTIYFPALAIIFTSILNAISRSGRKSLVTLYFLITLSVIIGGFADSLSHLSLVVTLLLISVFIIGTTGGIAAGGFNNNPWGFFSGIGCLVAGPVVYMENSFIHATSQSDYVDYVTFILLVCVLGFMLRETAALPLPAAPARNRLGGEEEGI